MTHAASTILTDFMAPLHLKEGRYLSALQGVYSNGAIARLSRKNAAAGVRSCGSFKGTFMNGA
jgi:hypothetical protein